MISSREKNRPAFLDQPESRRLEFKESFPKGEQVARTAAAFSNEGGGRIVFGVKDSPRTIIGIPEDRIFSLEEQIINCIFDLCVPPIVPEIYIQTVGGKTLLVAEIFPGPEKPYYLKKYGKQNGTYIRVGSSNRKASANTIDELERRRRKVPFDSLAVYDLKPEEIDLTGFIKTYQKFTGNKLTRAKQENMGLIYRERNRQYPTHAALLLCDSPIRGRFFPYAKIECARFKGVERRTFLDQATLDGPIYGLIEPCMTFIKKNIALSATIGEIYRKDRWEYPLEAIREALVNAVIHRDYSLTGSDIKMAIYDDMLEITSPGSLPDTLPVEELGTGRSEIRNRVLAPIFKDLKLIEAWGSGIQKMRQELKNYPEIELVLQESGHSFQVQFIKKDLEKPDDGQGQGTVRAESGQSQGRVRAESGQGPGRVVKSLTKTDLPKKLDSMEQKIINVLSEETLSKSEIAHKIGLKNVTGHLNRTIRWLLENGSIVYTIPEKPTSRLQKYKIKKKE
ncbi:MAG: putative DNA binding domain-containing protein [Desulfurivibrionaceae bacterium]